MALQKKDLVKYGARVVTAGLTAGACGNVSGRDGNIIWIKPSGTALDEMTVDDLCGIDIRTGDLVAGGKKPSTDMLIHLEIYRRRSDVGCVFYTHPPWAMGIISAGVTIKPLLVMFVSDLGRVATIPYTTPSTHKMADSIGQIAQKADTILVVNHGILTTGGSVRQAYYRSVVVENCAKAMVAASVVGKPRPFDEQKIEEIHSLKLLKDRQKIVGEG